MQNEKLRHYLGAIGVFLLVIFLLMFLAFNEIPAKNKDIFVSTVGVITGTIGAIIAVIVGRDPDRENELKKKVDSQSDQIEFLIKQKDELEGMLIKMQETLIENISSLTSKKK
jgi:NADH:ubiquinone oxidoreductase subunit 6 (subunit J)